MRKRAIQRVREDKENLIPEKPGSRSNRRRYYASSRSPLPSDYPRDPLQDIRIYVNGLRTARRLRRRRVSISDISHLRQLMIHESPPSRMVREIGDEIASDDSDSTEETTLESITSTTSNKSEASVETETNADSPATEITPMFPQGLSISCSIATPISGSSDAGSEETTSPKENRILGMSIKTSTLKAPQLHSPRTTPDPDTGIPRQDAKLSDQLGLKAGNSSVGSPTVHSQATYNANLVGGSQKENTISSETFPVRTVKQAMLFWASSSRRCCIGY